MGISRYICFLLVMAGFLAIDSGLFAQQQSISGTVRNAATNELMAFVNIRVNDGRFGTTTDIDGHFKLPNHEPIHRLSFTHVGFEPLTLDIGHETAELHIALIPKQIELTEVVIFPGENPAHRIILQAFANRDKNNHEKLPSFSYLAYDKMVFTIDSSRAVQKPPAYVKTPVDTLAQKENFIDKRDFFLMETVTERIFMAPGRSREKILATRISGLRDPIFIFLLSQFQSTGFYDDFIRIGERSFVNPISRGSTGKYLFVLEETTPDSKNDTIFTISFRPRINTNFEGLKGVMMIHSDGWAVQNVVAEPASKNEGFDIRIQQLYERIDGKQWFPVQLNTDLVMPGLAADDGLYQYPVVGSGRSYIRDIVIEPELLRRQFGNIAIEVDENAPNQNEDFWNQYRIRALSDRDWETYRYLDSLNRVYRFDRLASGLETLLSGRIPVWLVEFELDKTFRFNSHERFYLGLGARTNQRFSSRLVLNAFGGYGFGDKTPKYNLGGKLKIDPYGSTNISLNYYQKAIESGGIVFPGRDIPIWNPEGYRDYFVNRMDLAKGFDVWLENGSFSHFKLFFGFENQSKKAYYPYHFGPEPRENILARNSFTFTKARLAARFAYGEKFMQTSRSLVSLGTDFPVLLFQYTRGLDGVLGGGFAFNKYDLQLDWTLRTKYYGNTGIRITAGLAEGAIPYMELFISPASWRSFSLYAPASFATMRMNEFLSDRYLGLFLTHDFGKLLYKSGKFQPEFQLATHIGFGSLENPGMHHGIAFKTMEKGFFESGLLIGNLLKLPPFTTIGAAAFYRYGPYSLPNAWHNLGLKLMLEFGL